jgi:DNA polymerase III alpha subunit
MYKDNVGFPIFNSQDVFDMIYQGKSDKIMDLLVEDSEEVRKFNSFSEKQLNIYQLNISNESDIKCIDSQLQSFWFIPDEYKQLDVLEFLYMKCKTTEQRDRVLLEWNGYCTHGMADVLRLMIYIVDVMQENNIVWGVGRGSSVASYILYLIGIHCIDSIKYDLDFYEFMR